MKKLLVLAIAAMLSMGVYSQNVTRQGNVFVQTTTVSKDTLVTKYQYRDSKGKEYPIVINKANGRCYVWRKSSKSGRMYKQYMSADICKVICKELGVKYVETKTK